MQELTTAPQMTSPYTPAGGSNMPTLAAAQPKLGTPIPGTTGGLAAKPGLTVYDNPLPQSLQSNPQQSAQQAQSYGRGEDTVLVHMTPEEVNSLQGLAMAHGGSLTINPHTGLPEAGWLGKLLPMLLGGLGMLIPGAQPWMLGLAGAAGGTAATGDLRKGLLMGLGAFGGASLAGGLGVGAEAAKTAATGVTTGATGVTMPTIGIQSAGSAVPTSIGAGALGGGAVPTSLSAGTLGSAGAGLGASLPGLSPAVTAPLNLAGNAAGQGSTGILSKISAASKAGLPSGILQKAAPYAAGMGALNTVSELSQPNLPKYTPEKETPYVPMGPGKREVRYQTPEQMRQSGGAEFTYFTPSNPDPVPLSQQDSSLTDEIRRDYGYADGGLAALPAPEGFNDLINYFGATNPGAITASMYPTSAAATQAATPAAPATGREQVYNFTGRTSTNPTGGTGAGAGTGFDLGGLSGIDWGQYLSQYNQTTPTMPAAPTSAQPTPIYGDWRDSWMPRNDTTQPTTSSYDFTQPNEQGYPALDGFYDSNSMASGGSVDMGNGSFVVDARTVSELGNGSSNAGREILARMGGRPLDGPGDGVSDSIPARVGGSQKARVARDEVIMPPEAVRRIGGGDEKRGTQKLYALMDKAHKARKNAKRGQDTKLAKGLGALA